MPVSWLTWPALCVRSAMPAPWLTWPALCFRSAMPVTGPPLGPLYVPPVPRQAGIRVRIPRNQDPAAQQFPGARKPAPVHQHEDGHERPVRTAPLLRRQGSPLLPQAQPLHEPARHRQPAQHHHQQGRQRQRRQRQRVQQEPPSRPPSAIRLRPPGHLRAEQDPASFRGREAVAVPTGLRTLVARRRGQLHEFLAWHWRRRRQHHHLRQLHAGQRRHGRQHLLRCPAPR